jgi:two-component system cell cycle sensor histidine kinase/response regulator CckA
VPVAIKHGLRVFLANDIGTESDRGTILARAQAATGQLFATAEAFAGRSWLLLVLGLLSGAFAVVTPEPEMRLAATTAGLTLGLLAVLLSVLARSGRLRGQDGLGRIATLVQEDAAPCFSTDGDGQILYLNAAAEQRFGPRSGQTLASALGDHFANPGSVLYRLQSRAAAAGAAREDVVTRRGHTRLSVHRVDPLRFLWRLEEMMERPGPGRGAEALSLPMLVANKAGVVLFMNEAMRRLLGGRARRLDRIFTTEIATGMETVVSTEAGAVRAIVAEIEGPGERREIYLLPLPAQGGRPLPASSGTAFDDLPVALLKLAPDGAILAATHAARDLLRVPEGEMIHLPDLVEGLGRSVADWIADVLAERNPGGSEMLRARHGDPDNHLKITLRRIIDHGRPLVLAVLADATELKTLEAQFAQSQKMQAIGQFAGGIAHDFNNLLTAISGHCDLLLLRHDRDGPEYADLVQIHQNANRAAALVGQLLAFSRKQTLKPERIDLQDVLADLTHLLNRLVGERVRLDLRHAPKVGPIRADKRQLEQVIMNLVVNARDAMPSGGTIRIETEQVRLTEEFRRDRAVVPPGDYALISVRDSGCGIPPERLSKIFEPFYTTKRPGEGTGLGLSTAYGIVKQSGGFIFVDSVVGEGSTFQIYFPINGGAVEAVEAAAPQPRRASPRPPGGVVLLVEDEAPVRAFASRALRLRGYTVIEAENAEEALRTLEDPSVDVDIFVTDVVMPGMDGPSWVRRALEDRPNVKVVFVSGYAEDSFADAQVRIPNSVFLPKPFSLNELTATVQDQLH